MYDSWASVISNTGSFRSLSIVPSYPNHGNHPLEIVAHHLKQVRTQKRLGKMRHCL